MNIFQTAISDIFNVNDFLENCLLNGRECKCICSQMPQGVAFSDVGLVEEEDFTLKIKLPIPFKIERGMKCVFRGVEYKVLMSELDSANASLTIHLQSLSKA